MPNLGTELPCPNLGLVERASTAAVAAVAATTLSALVALASSEALLVATAEVNAMASAM